MTSDFTANTAISILCSYIKNEQLNIDLNEEQIKDLFLVMKAHDLTHLPGLTIIDANNKPKYEMFQRAQFMAAMRYEQQQYQRMKISELFENNGIKYVHLKGSVIAQLYRESWHRTSCDIDILLNKSDIDKAVKLLSDELGYKLRQNMTDHDISLFLGDNIHVELHYDLCESCIDLNDAMKSAEPASGKKYEYVFTPEIIMLYHYAHMATHFKKGGIGLKSVLDLYLLEHNVKYDKEILNNLLTKGGIKKFADAMLHITKVWFEDGKPDELTDILKSFIFDSGAYGSLKHTVTMYMHESLEKNAGSGNFKYAINRIFLPYKDLKYIYPILLKHKSLIPVYQIKRWITLLSPKRFGKVKKEIKTVAGMNADTSCKIIDMLKELELLDSK
ncbi:MAG: nucleotidyltransferase family protein [Clostridia bacterium]|nr:nucleotidyltransferase family protein [Clostridia bacterium]